MIDQVRVAPKRTVASELCLENQGRFLVKKRFLVEGVINDGASCKIVLTCQQSISIVNQIKLLSSLKSKEIR